MVPGNSLQIATKSMYRRWYVETTRVTIYAVLINRTEAIDDLGGSPVQEVQMSNTYHMQSLRILHDGKPSLTADRCTTPRMLISQPFRIEHVLGRAAFSSSDN